MRFLKPMNFFGHQDFIEESVCFIFQSKMINVQTKIPRALKGSCIIMQNFDDFDDFDDSDGFGKKYI